jgi:hypothetical protein
MYLEPSVAQAPRFARHLVDKRRHVFDLTAGKARIYSWRKRHIMRNPDPWQPREPDPGPAPTTRRAALIGLAVVLILMLAVFSLTHTLGGSARLQDCALSGRSNCSAKP